MPGSPSLTDLTNNATYLAACHFESSLVNVKDIACWNHCCHDDNASTASASSDTEASLIGDESETSSRVTV